jgi:ankyrin repeat protein
VRDLRADVNQANKYGVTSLYFAAQEGQLDAVKCLVTELGADVNKSSTKTGRMPMMLAARNEHIDVLECLLELGADIDKVDNRGLTPLCVAAQIGHLTIVRCLLKHRANINYECDDGATPLVAAAWHKHVEVVTWLVKAGADTQAAAVDSSVSKITAADISKRFGALTTQTAYLEAKTHCSNTGCSGVGIMKCTRCKQVRYCGEPCQLAHWRVQKADCKRWSAELKAGKGK